MNILKKLDDVVDKTLINFSLFCLVGLFIILVCNVFFRAIPLLSIIPNFSMGWFDEIVELLFAWMIMTTSSVLCRRGGHFQVDIIQTKIKNERTKSTYVAVINIVSLIFFMALFYYGWKLTQDAVQTTPVLHIAKRWMYLCIPFNAFIMSMYTIRDVINNIIKAVKFI